ncbi:MAG: hypothetical protein ACR2NV_07340 [Thermoleophilaceae bacterium]
MNGEVVLEIRQRSVLAEMQFLSESPGASFVTTQKRAPKKEGTPPSGARHDRSDNPDAPPEKNRSLYDHYAFRFARADTTRKKRLLCWLAERDLDHHVRGNRRTLEGKEERDARILSEYAGLDATEAAIFEGVGERHVRQLRSAKGRDPALGHLVQ